MVAYFCGIPGVRLIPEGYNPATWMLEVSTLGAEERMGLDLAEVYRNSDLCRYACVLPYYYEVLLGWIKPDTMLG
jgi:hypothetical protein